MSCDDGAEGLMRCLVGNKMEREVDYQILSLLDLIPWTLESKQRQKYPLVMF